MRIALLGAAICFSAADICIAQNVEPAIRQSTHIPPQQLSSALRTFGKERGLQIVYRSDVVGDVLTQGADGELTAEEAIERLLRGTGLTYHYVDDRTITIALPVPEKQAIRGTPHSSLLSRLLAYFGSAVAGTAAVPAYAQDAPGTGATLEEIIITAERRTSDVQKTATSVSVRTGEELEQQGRRSLTEILRDVPNVAAPEPLIGASGGSETRGGNITIRGVGGSPGGGGTGGTLTGSSTTAAYVDGIYEGIGGDYDIARVEVLRGPQGTLYGRSATSGVVGTYTRDPTLGEFSGNATAQLSSYTQQLYTGAVNLPLGSDFAMRAAVSKSQADKGYYNGAGGGYDRVHGRIKALYKPSDDLSLLFGFAFEENDQNTGGCSGRSPADGVVLYNNCLAVNTTNNKGRQYWLNFAWDLGPVTLSYQPTLRTYKQRGTSAVVGPNLHPLLQTIATPYDQFVTHELRLASNSNSKLTWQTGLFAYHNKIDAQNTNRWTESGALVFDSPTSRDTKDYGIFGEATYPFTDATRLTLGARYDYTRVNTSQVYTANANQWCNAGPGLPPNPGQACNPAVTGVGQPEINNPITVNENTTPSGLHTWRKSNYKVRLEHDFTPSNLMYAVVSTGFIPGDVNVSSGSTVNVYDAEVLTAYEIGSKNRFLDDTLQANAALFYYDYGGFQNTVQPDANNPLISTTFTVPAKMQGAELELLYQLTAKDRLGLNYAYLDSWWVDKPAAFAAVIPWKHRNVVPHTVSANYEHTFNLPGDSTLSARIDGTWTSARRGSNPSTTTLNSATVGPGILNYSYIDPETIGNFNINWNSPDRKYSVGGYVRNFTDHRRINYTVRSLTPRSIDASQTEPLTYGVMLSARF